jgi:hypothetical protein
MENVNQTEIFNLAEVNFFSCISVTDNYTSSFLQNTLLVVGPKCQHLICEDHKFVYLCSFQLSSSFITVFFHLNNIFVIALNFYVVTSVVWRKPKLWRNILPHSSGSKNRASMKPAEADDNTLKLEVRVNHILKVQFQSHRKTLHFY